MSEAIAPRPGGGGRSVGGYDLVCEITRGVLGTLWVARATEENRPPGALIRRIPVPKNPKARDKIAEGAEWARHGNDPRLPRVIEITPSDEEVAIAVPFVEGEPLRALLRAAAFKRESLGTPVAVRIAVETLELLHAVHERTKYDPMHRAFGGLQPDSILIATDGLPRLLDVGVGVSCNEAAVFMKEAQWIAYLAPEQLAGREATAATDVFSAGAVLWEMLANRRLFAGATADSVKQRVKDGPIQRLDELRGLGAQPLEKPIADVVARALERDPDKRYESAAAMSDALREVVTPADPKDVAAAVERLASQFLDKRRAVLKKAGLELEPLDGRTGFIVRQESRSAARASLRPEATDGSGGLSALTRQSTAGAGASSRIPPPPPSRRGTSMPPSPPSAHGSAAPQSRADRALALAKAASVAAPPPPRSVPPAAPSSRPAPPPPAASSAPPGPGASAPSAPASVPPRPGAAPSAPASVPPRPGASAPPPAVAPAGAAGAPAPVAPSVPPAGAPAAAPVAATPAPGEPAQAAPVAAEPPARTPMPGASAAAGSAAAPSAVSVPWGDAPAPARAPSPMASSGSPSEANAISPEPGQATPEVPEVASAAQAMAAPAAVPQESGPGLEPLTGGPAGASDVGALSAPAIGGGGMAAMQTATPPVGAGSPRSLELEATTGSGMAAGIDDDFEAPFARRSGSRKGLFIGLGAVAVLILAVVAMSGGADEDEPSAAAPPAAPAPAPAPVPAPVAAEPAAEPEEPSEPDDESAEASDEGAESEDSDEADDPEPKEEEDTQATVERPSPRPRAVPRPRPRRAPPAAAPKEPPKDVGASFKPGGI